MSLVEENNIHYTIEEITNMHDKPIEIPSVVPKLVFIVPYRDRENQKEVFTSQMKVVMSDYKEEDYKICYIHQCDKRNFNRGAMKNIGFLFVKQQYPDSYEDITLIFNDVDTMPIAKNILPYQTTKNNVKHFYGFKHTLGGIVSITCADFEKVNGFPNYWAWGYEDNSFLNRIMRKKINVDREVFFKYKDSNIQQLNDSNDRIINRMEYEKYKHNLNDGIDKLMNVKYEYNEEDGFVNVSSFDTYYKNDTKYDKVYNIKKGSRPYQRRVARMQMHI